MRIEGCIIVSHKYIGPPSCSFTTWIWNNVSKLIRNGINLPYSQNSMAFRPRAFNRGIFCLFFFPYDYAINCLLNKFIFIYELPCSACKHCICSVLQKISYPLNVFILCYYGHRQKYIYWNFVWKTSKKWHAIACLFSNERAILLLKYNLISLIR